MKKNVFLTLLAAVLLAGCTNEYNKILMSSDTAYKYECAKQYFAMGKFNQASQLLQDVVIGQKGRSTAQESLYMIGRGALMKPHLPAMIKSGLVSATFKGLEVQQVLRIARNAGLQAIEWSENHHIPCGDEAFASTVGKLTADAGLEIAGYGSYYRLGQGTDILPSLRTAKAIGAKQVRIWAGTKASADVCAEERKALVKELVQACRTASDMGIVLNLEWHKNTLTDTNESGLALLRETACDNLHTLWQPTMIRSKACSRCLMTSREPSRSSARSTTPTGTPTSR